MIVGIDLGTTNSLAAVWRDGASVLVPNGLGEYLTPSCVSIDEDDSVLVGKAARERLQTHPERTAAVFKRYMGSNKTVRLGKREFRPEELSALVLRSLKADAEAMLGEPVTEAVITVPAYFSDAQRKATRAAGELAGLKVERLLNEPTAAALAYGMHDMRAETRFLVFDLGGGTFDVSILEMFEGVMEVRASAGDNFLGGEDFVEALIALFFERNKLPASLRTDAHFMQRLAAQTEAAKRALSTQPTAEIVVAHEAAQHRLSLDEGTLEQACAALLKRLRAPVERALRDANLRAGELDAVVLAGGATRMPVVRRLATTMFGRFPSIDFNPDEVVALGAAVQAGLKARDAALKEVVMTDVAPYSLGVAVSRWLSDTTVTHGHFDPIIERNSTVPVSRSKSYVPNSGSQTSVDLHVFQGESRMVRDNVHLGTLHVPLPSLGAGASPGDAAVEVRFTYDVNGLLQVEATVQKTQETFSLLIEGNPGLLSEAEIKERLAALSALKIHPRDRIENRTLLARAERIYQQLRGDVREWLGIRIAEFERVLALQDKRQIAAMQRQFQEQLEQIERDGPLAD
ncbi:2-alkenal reductase [Variovorax paradoxus]|jgi:molecular chaperone HscC|nr:molecular chaperone HscC [Variovorax sp.]KPU88137.1 2-alkenal reductase [Variovorax paradoxus]KPU90300.1 2-alkenal reductase [Variovorax paradoxus]KPV04884.1 2-alkenal reductase [Variovorax paradoxus]KPV18827.1 2-alkenal reductase [Variovorax paradoxus]KPV19372.1 2-alkenal reductase [Variovorax paradoxus]